MTPEQLSAAIVEALAALTDEGALSLPGGAPAQVVVERPKSKEHGDYATNVAMQLAKRAGMPPRELAAALAARLGSAAGVASVEVAGPGFLNIRVEAAAQGEVAARIVAAGTAYGSGEAAAGHRVNVEFVSANPTGPVTLASARWAAVGDAIARLVQASGAEVAREYYFNDHGAQIDRFARSLLARGRGRELPDGGYAGGYIDEIARQVLAEHPEIADLSDDQAQEAFREHGVASMFAEIKRTLHGFGVDFDVYFHENDLHESGAVKRAIERLTAMGNIYEKDGAVWIRTEKYGDDKDRVIVKSDGTGAYISGDAAYYLDKRERGFDRCLILLGADHHGYVSRLMALCASFGDQPGTNLEVLIGQMVNLVRNGQPLRMSKRAGDVITLEDLVDAVGVDAARYALVRYSMDAGIDIDLELWAKQSSDNPVFYVQYAHARLASILRNAGELGMGGFEARSARTSTTERVGEARAARTSTTGVPDTALLTHPLEGDLLRALAEFPRVVSSAAELREPHRVARYLEDTASSFHKFYDSCRVLPQGEEEPAPIHAARLLLVEATRVVLANGLGLLGVSAPDRM